jgi:predicted ATPase
VIHELCQCRQAGCTDPDTAASRVRFLVDLARLTEPQRVPVNRMRWVMTATTATSTTSTWRYEP